MMTMRAYYETVEDSSIGRFECHGVVGYDPPSPEVYVTVEFWVPDVELEMLPEYAADYHTDIVEAAEDAVNQNSKVCDMTRAMTVEDVRVEGDVIVVQLIGTPTGWY